jgi:hypothetical protein
MGHAPVFGWKLEKVDGIGCGVEINSLTDNRWHGVLVTGLQPISVSVFSLSCPVNIIRKG